MDREFFDSITKGVLNEGGELSMEKAFTYLEKFFPNSKDKKERVEDVILSLSIMEDIYSIVTNDCNNTIVDLVNFFTSDVDSDRNIDNYFDFLYTVLIIISAFSIFYSENAEVDFESDEEYDFGLIARNMATLLLSRMVITSKSVVAICGEYNRLREENKNQIQTIESLQTALNFLEKK